MTFGTLAVIGLAGLAGPLVALPQAWRIPLVFGELVAGAVLGTSGFAVLDPTDPTFRFLADVGFALAMFVAGSHVPVGDPRLNVALRSGLMRAVAVGVVATALGAGVALGFGTGHAALYAVLFASSSAALVLPVVQSAGLSGIPVLGVLVQVAVADAACIVALPLVLDPHHAARAALGSVIVLAGSVVLFVVLNGLERRGWRKRAHKLSEERRFALELRINLILLFALAALAIKTRVSIMLAGFSFGLVVAAVGEPRRLARQLFAVADGFFAPLFFVWLGASVNLRQLGTHPSAIALGVALGFGAVLAHLVGFFLRQPLPLAGLAAAQVGVPIGATTIGTQLHVLRPGEAGAVLLGAVITILVATVSGAEAARKQAQKQG